MKIKYFIPILLIVLIFSLISCSPVYNSKKTIDSLEAVRQANMTAETTIPIKTTIDVKYIVLGYSSIMDTVPCKVSVTYSNSQGGTEQINGIQLKKKPSTIGMGKVEDDVGFLGELIAEYKNFPIDEFMYLSAQNQNDFGNIMVDIFVDGVPFKYSLAKGGYSIATASGVYGE